MNIHVRVFNVFPLLFLFNITYYIHFITYNNKILRLTAYCCMYNKMILSIGSDLDVHQYCTHNINCGINFLLL